MNKRIKYLFLLLPIPLFFLIKIFFYLFVFNEGVSITGKNYALVNNRRVDYKCGESTSAHRKDLTIRFKYEYPLVDFKGKMIIEDRIIPENDSTGRILYSGAYKRAVTIKDICYDPDNSTGDSMELSFLFITKKKIYSWNTFDTLPVLNYRELEIQLIYDDHLGAPRAIITKKT